VIGVAIDIGMHNADGEPFTGMYCRLQGKIFLDVEGEIADAMNPGEGFEIPFPVGCYGFPLPDRKRPSRSPAVSAWRTDC